MVWARLNAVYFVWLVTKELYYKLWYVFDDFIWYSLVYDKIINIHQLNSIRYC